MSTTTQSGNGHPPTAPALRSLTRRIHYLAGLAIGPFLVVLCLTGLAHREGGPVLRPSGRR